MNWLRNKKITVAVHDGNFHPDDVFSVALLSLVHRGNIKVTRTRDPQVCSKSDYVLDLGGEYDPDKNRFDHHQTGGAGVRANKIAYSTFGLLWQKYGDLVCGTKEIANILDKKLVTVIDADDNGFNLYQPIINDIYPITLPDIIYGLWPTWKEDVEKRDGEFFKAVHLAKEIILRAIKVSKDKMEITKVIQDFYQKSSDKRIILIDLMGISRYDIWEALWGFSEPLFVVWPDKNNWSVVAMRKNLHDYGNRKDFPSTWAGLRDEGLAQVSGVSDALFCHNNLFLAVAKSKEGAVKLAEIALKTL
jgi:uncharacterized UPF0160 family protein